MSDLTPEVMKEMRHSRDYWSAEFKRLASKHANELLDAVEERDRLRVQLAGCSVAAEGATEDPAVKGQFGWSPSYQDVLNLRLNYDALRKHNTELEAELKRLYGIDETCRSLGADLHAAQERVAELEGLAVRWEKDATQYLKQVEEARAAGTPHDQMLATAQTLRACAKALKGGAR